MVDDGRNKRHPQVTALRLAQTLDGSLRLVPHIPAPQAHACWHSTSQSDCYKRGGLEARTQAAAALIWPHKQRQAALVNAALSASQAAFKTDSVACGVSEQAPRTRQHVTCDLLKFPLQRGQQAAAGTQSRKGEAMLCTS